MCKELTEFKNEHIFLKDVNSQSLQQTLKNLETAFDRFFRKLAKFPNFKSKHRSKSSFKVPQGIKIDDKTITLPKTGKIKFKGKIDNLSKINSVTVSRDSDGCYYASIQGEYEIKKLANNDKVIGIDLGIKEFAVTSENQIFKNSKFLKRKEKKLKFLSRKHSKAKGNSREKKRQLLAKQHFKVKKCREDFLHKVSNQIINENQVIIIEDLNVKGMMQNHKLAKSIGDVSWGKFVSFLEYKAEWHDRKIVRIDRFYPSSKTCSSCHSIKTDLKLKDRTYHCDNCGLEIDRDLNAAINIKQQGINILSGCGTQSDVKQKPVERLSLESVMTLRSHRSLDRG